MRLTVLILALFGTAFGWFVSLPVDDPVVPDWVMRASRYQNGLAWDVPLNHRMVLGSHNSYASDNYTLPCVLTESPRNQKFTITQQLTYLNVRRLKLDIRYIQALGEFHTCHMSQASVETFRQSCLAIDNFTTCAAYGFPDYGDDAGCATSSPLASTILNEIKSWIDLHPMDFIVVTVEDYFHGNDELFHNMTVEIFGKTLYTLTEFNAGKIAPYTD
jgi:hypothetical protein